MKTVECSLSDVESLRKNPAWGVFEAYLENSIDFTKNELVTCPLEDVPKARGKVEAYQSAISFFDNWLESLTIDRGDDDV